MPGVTRETGVREVGENVERSRQGDAGQPTWVRTSPEHRFELQLAYLSTHPGAFVERVDAGGCATAVRWRDRPTFVEVRVDGEGSVGDVSVKSPKSVKTSSPVEPAPLSGIRESQSPTRGVWVRGPVEVADRMFQFEADIRGFDNAVAGSPLEPVHQLYRGFKPVCMADPFQGMCWVIVGQQVNVTFAAKLKRTLVEKFGDTLQVGEAVYRVFPSPERIAGLEPEDLRPFQFSRQKASYLISLARRIVNGWDTSVYEGMEAEEAIAHLTQVKGVGRWSAECFLLFVFRHPDVLPAADIGLRRALGKLLGLGRNATEAELREFGRMFAGWRSYVSQYLWLALREGRWEKEAVD